MIDVSQWRSSIGLWYSSCQPLYCLRSVKSSTVLGQSEREQLLSSLIEILLILSGNVELNPGPMTDDVRKILQDVLRENFADLSEAIKHCVPHTAELMHSSGLISEHTAFDANNLWSMIDEFNSKMLFKNDISELQSHCQLFLDCLSCQGGHPLEVAQHLAKIWTERVQQELKISLSFDVKHVQPVETTSSSTSSSTDPIMAAASPQMDQSTNPFMAATSPQMDQSTHPIMAATSPQMDQSTHPIMAAAIPQMDQSTHPIMAAASPQMDQSTHPIMAATSPQMDQSTHPIMAATSPHMDQSTHPIMAATSPQMDQSTHPIMAAASPQMDQSTHPIMAATSPQMDQSTHPIMAAASPHMDQWTHPIMAATSPQMGQSTNPFMAAASPQMGQSTHPIMAATSPQMDQWTHPIMAATSPHMDQSTHPIMAATSPQMDQSTHPIMAAASPHMDQWTHPIMAATSPQMGQSTNPFMAAAGPQMGQSTHPIMAATSPQMDQLSEWLKSLVEWENFAIYLPGMTNDDVEIIKKDEKTVKDQKRALYSKWLEVCPTASWNDVITALERDKKMTLADDVRRKLNEIQSPSNSLADNRNEDISSGTDNHMEFSPQSRDGEDVNDAIEMPSDDENQMKGSLIALSEEFADLLISFKEEYKKLVEQGTLDHSTVIDYIKIIIGTDKDLSNCQTIDDLLKNIEDFFDFLECRVIVKTAEKYLLSDLANKFKTHLKNAEELRSSKYVKTLREQLHQIYKPHINSPKKEKAPKARIDLHTVWDDVTIAGLYTLMRKFFTSKRARQLILENLEIFKSSVHIVYYMTESQDEIKQIIEYCQQNVSIMRYIGIFGLMIDGVIILDDQHEDEHYTFEYGLLKAAEDGHHEAVQFLVELGIDVNHVTEEGQTPLTLAITNSHGHVMETLISAGANVNPQVKWTPLAIAVKREDPLELTRYLLDHGAHCNVLIDGTSILDMTSHEETYQLLYQHNAAMKTQELITFRYFELRDKLDELTGNVQKCLNDLLSAGNITLTQVKDQVIDYTSPDTRCESVEELLVLLQPFCSIFNVNPLKAVTEKFLGCENMADFDDYSKNLNDFEMSTKLRYMVHVMGCVTSDIQPSSSSNVTIKFNSQWKDRLLADVRKLHEHCFISIHQFLTLTDVNEEDSKIVLTYKVPSSPQCCPVISTEQQQFMKQIGICEVIVDLLVNDDDQEMSLERVLQQAADDNNYTLISFLMSINVTISDEPQHGQSSSQPFQSTLKSPNEQLMYAASIGDNDTVKLLLDQNIVDVNYCNEDGKTPLMMAAGNNHLNVLETLLLAGASKLVNHQCNNGTTALMFASLKGHLEVVKCLLTEGINLNVQTNDGWTALVFASLKGHLEVVKCLLTEGIDLNVQNNDGTTALMFASLNGHLEVVKCLLTEGVDINVQNNDGLTALMCASANGHLEVVKCLLKKLNDIKELTGNVQKCLNDLLSAGNITLTQVKDEVIDYISPNTRCESVKELFVLIQPFCSFFNVNPLKSVAEKFLGSEIMADFDDHLKNLNDFEMSTKLRYMVHVMGVASDIQPRSSSNVTIKFNSQWKDRLLADVRKLHEHCFISIHQFLTLTDVNEEDSKIVLTYKIPSSPQCSPLILIEQQQFMKQIGICEVIVDDVILLVNDDDQEMSLERVLQQAVDDNNYNLISFLMDINVTISDEPHHGQSSSPFQSTLKSPNEQLMYAASIGDNDTVKSLLDQNIVDVNYCNEDGKTPLMMAAGNNHLNVLETLLLAGASKLVNRQDNNGTTALMFASLNGHLEVVKCLLTEGVDINVQTNDGWTALMFASANGHLEVVKCLLIKSANLNIQSNDNITALLAASCGGHYQIVEILLQNDADININDDHFIFPTPLCMAVAENHIEVIHVLLTKISQHSINNLNIAMMAAIVMNRHEVLRVLLEAGVNPNFDLKFDSKTLQQLNTEDFTQHYLSDDLNDPLNFILEKIDRFSMTPLLASLALGHIEMVDLLLQYNADPNAEDIAFGYNALHMAAACNHPDIVDKLLFAGAQTDHQSNDGLTALMVASQNGHLEVVKCLLKRANPNIVNKDGFTVLTLMCVYTYIDDDTIQLLKLHCIPILELLLDANASPVVIFSDGWELSSLTAAAYANNLDAVNVLMGRVEFSNELITHAMIAACYVGNPSVINALSHKITNLPHKELLLSCAEGDIAGVISAIYESNVNPNTPLVCGLTPLMVASSCGHIELMDALIQAGVDINLPNDNGHTPLDIVDHEYILPPNQDVISILVEHGAIHKNPVDDDKLLLHYPINNLGTDDVSSVNKPNILVKLMQMVEILQTTQQHVAMIQMTLQHMVIQKTAMPQMASVSQIHQPQFAT